MEVRDLINKNLINLSFDAETKEEILREIARMVDSDFRLSSQEMYYQGLIEREQQFSTGVGYGIAIPHAKNEAVKTPTLVIIKLNKSMEWESIDDKPVNLIVGLAVPEAQGNTAHLKIISKLSMKLMEDDFRQSLIEAENDDKILSLMDTVC